MPIVTLPGYDPVLYIHIPKTGGSSIEDYYMLKGVPKAALLGDVKGLRHTLQHCTYIEYVDMYSTQDISVMKKVAAVRNPYTRVISDLFYWSYISPNYTPEKVFEVLKLQYIDLYKKDSQYKDNHVRPQTDFLVDKDNKMISNLHILRTETLTRDMHQYGYTDFNQSTNTNISKISESEYMKYLNTDSIRLINTTYERDFKMLGYPMIQI